MKDDIVDLLQVKIEKAKSELPQVTQDAISAVDWRVAILGLRAKKGYDFEQLGNLETETELVLCGLLSPADYPRELEKRMRISRTDADKLVAEMNELVFKKIREELIKNIEREKSPENKTKISTENILENQDTQILNSTGIEIVPESLELPAPIKPAESRQEIINKIERPEVVHPILAQKMSGSFQMPMTKTEHTPENLTSSNTPTLSATPNTSKPKVDPYRMPIE